MLKHWHMQQIQKKVMHTFHALSSQVSEAHKWVIPFNCSEYLRDSISTTAVPQWNFLAPMHLTIRHDFLIFCECLLWGMLEVMWTRTINLCHGFCAHLSWTLFTERLSKCDIGACEIWSYGILVYNYPIAMKFDIFYICYIFRIKC